MTLPTTGQMTAEMISGELGRTTTTTMSMDESTIRSMAGKVTAGSAVAMQDFYGKSKDTPYYIGTVTIGVTNDSGYVWYGFISGGAGARNPTAISGFNFDWFQNYTTGSTGSNIVISGNATAQPWATGNGKITIGTLGVFPIGVGTYDSKLNWTSFAFEQASTAIGVWMSSRVGQTIDIRIAV